MITFRCYDESGVREDFQAHTARDAAQEYVDSGDWGDTDTTWWCYVHTVEIDAEGEEIEGSEDSFRIAVEPKEPACVELEHDWDREHVSGHGGGVIVESTCEHCGHRRIVNTWAQCRSSGVQGLRSVAYREPEHESAAA